MTEKTVRVDDHSIELSSLDKLMFPEAGISKGDLIDYYRRIADIMLPHLRGRPISMQRFPDGIEQQGFYQKEAPDYFPEWINRAQVGLREEGGTQPQVVCNDPSTLVYLANQGCITPHRWLSRADRLDHPDLLIFDLDPSSRGPDSGSAGSDGFEAVRTAARMLRELLQQVGLEPLVMTTGSRGLHVVTPLDRSAGFDQVRHFARDLAAVLAGHHPDELTVETRKTERRGRLFLDYLRNAYAQTAVTPYAVRALPGAPVATPLDWRELSDSDLDSQTYTMANIFRRLGQKADPWRDMHRHGNSLKEPQQRLSTLEAET